MQFNKGMFYTPQDKGSLPLKIAEPLARSISTWEEKETETTFMLNMLDVWDTGN